MNKLFRNKYGYFDPEQHEYVITRPDTPRPWSNIISNGTYGMTITQAGSGYSWIEHAQFNRLTRWDQDLTRDNWGKYVYIRDEDTGKSWSPTPKPAGIGKLKDYECRHGLGYTTISGRCQDVQSSITYFVDSKSPVEVWEITLKNLSRKKKNLSLFSYLEWSLGMAPDWHREFDKIFITTEFERKTGIFWATKTRWALPDPSGRPWARPYEYRGFHACFPKAVSFDSDQRSIIGDLGENQAPKCVVTGKLSKLQGRCNDGVASLQTRVSLRGGQTKKVVFVLGGTKTAAEARRIVARYGKPGAVDKELAAVKGLWLGLLGQLQVKTPDQSVNLLVNQWLPYQAISCRMWGRSAYYQTGGAYGYRDQLQDSLATLPLNPKICRDHIKRAAAHQFRDGTTLHWWHPITDDGAKKVNSDDLLWLPFVTARYIQETGDKAFLNEVVPFYDKGKGKIREHCRASIEQVLGRPSPRGIPTIVEGDWNDGLSCIGFDGTAESVWLAEFLYGILNDWCDALAYVGDRQAEKDIKRYKREAKRLATAINKYAWDGDWYIRATHANGILGSKKSKIGKIFLNAQTWALMYGLPTPARKKKMLAALNKHLYRDYGPLLFYPAFSKPDPGIGHLSQYAPGLRENGGLYTHAGCWAIIAEAIAGTPDRAFKVFNSFNPIARGKKPDHYYAEPYVTPGNVDGPQSPNFGRGGWTWYTGSASWMYRALTDYIMGIRATTDGLVVDPAVPASWKNYTFTRKYRGATYTFTVRNKSKGAVKRKVSLTMNGKAIKGNRLPIANKGAKVKVDVVVESA